MQQIFCLPSLLLLQAFATAIPTAVAPELQFPLSGTEPAAAIHNAASKPLPLLIWHGLGDKYDNDGLRSTGQLAEKVNPGTYVYYIRLDEDGGADQQATFFGNVTEQIHQVCEDLRDDKKLFPHHEQFVHVNALGFSQGGQFLRGLVQRCDAVRVKNLVTFGSQHNGISQFQQCGDWDFLCKGALALAKSNAFTHYVQSKLVPAQYYRTVNESTGLASDEYLKYSNFLADVNNERSVKNETYAERIAALEHFVMFVFEDDTTVIPKESGWFADVNVTSLEVMPLRKRKLYVEDWLGLKKLDEKQGLVFKNTSGGHMELDEKTLTDAFREYFS